MRRVQAILEFGKGLHEFSGGLARCDLVLMLHAQIAHEAGKQTFRRAHRLQREMCDCMPETGHRVAHFVPSERYEVDMLHDELDTFDSLIEPCSLGREETDSPFRLITRKCDESGEECERDR